MSNLEIGGNGYLLLSRSDEWYLKLPREELQKNAAQNKAWYERLVAAGKVQDGRPLARNGAMVSGKDGLRILDGPFAESKEVIAGYLLLNVETFEEAVAIAQSFPGLAHGISMEVRPLADECPINAHLEELARQEQPAGVNQ